MVLSIFKFVLSLMAVDLLIFTKDLLKKTRVGIKVYISEIVLVLFNILSI
jgi:hypothetical protein